MKKLIFALLLVWVVFFSVSGFAGKESWSKIGSDNYRIHAPSGTTNIGGTTVTLPPNIEFTDDHGFVVENGTISVSGPRFFGEVLKQAASPGRADFNVFDTFRKLTPRCSDGKKYQLSACVIRNTGAGWAFINDSEHAPVGFTGISITAGGQIRLDHVFGANKVATMLVVPDETFAAMGLIAGGSIGLNLSLITIAAPLEFFVNVGTGALTAPEHWVGSITTAVGAGYCNVTHPAAGGGYADDFKGRERGI